MHIIERRRGFTLIEMLVALVVGGMLMATLVALSGSVQRSFGRSKEITDLQNDLRYGIKMLGEDMTRAGFMHSAKPDQDYTRVVTNAGGVAQADLANYWAIRWVPPILELYGNYVSARDYRWDSALKTICCRNDYCPGDTYFDTCGDDAQYYDRYLLPFADGPGLVDYVFCPGILARVEVGKGRYSYHRVTGVSDATNTVTFDVSPEASAGRYKWINPVNRVQYQIQADGTYTVRYDSPTNQAQRYQLFRRIESCRDGVFTFADNQFLAEYILDPLGLRPGLELSVWEDTGAQLGVPSPMVNMVGPNQFYPDTGYIIDEPHQVRGMVITLRGRSRTEDPEFIIPNYLGDQAAAMRFGVDLDGIPANGLAHVREMSTVVEIPNLGLGPS